MAEKAQEAFVDNLGRVTRIKGIVAVNTDTTTTVEFHNGLDNTDYTVLVDLSTDGAARVTTKNLSSFVVTHTDPGSDTEFSVLIIN